MDTNETGKVLYFQCGILQNWRRRILIITISCIAAMFIYGSFYMPSRSVDNLSLVIKENRLYNASKVLKSQLANTIDNRIWRGKLPKYTTRLKHSDIVFGKCKYIPPPPNGKQWPEEEFIHDPVPSDAKELADPELSRVALEGSSSEALGEFIRLKIVLFDGYGKRKSRGGDLIRVWMKENSLGASSNGHVVDNSDGSYVVTLQAMWVGKPQIRIFLITPREVIAVQFKRRYMCPAIRVITAIYIKGTEAVEMPCDFDPYVPGYSELCNQTDLNYGHPWFCGKPRSTQFECSDWENSNDMRLPFDTMPSKDFTELEKNIAKLKYHVRPIPHNIAVVIQSGYTNDTRIIPNKPCNTVHKNLTWQATSPRGYMFRKVWQNSHCSIQLSKEHIRDCLKNTDVVLIGDSTVGQIFKAFLRFIPCDMKTPFVYVNAQLNLTMTIHRHMMPLCPTRPSHRTLYKTFTKYMEEIKYTRKTLLLLHIFAHQTYFHSHVFRATLINMRQGITQLLQRHNNVFIVIKGPHSYAFKKPERAIMGMPDRYADVFQEIYFEIFSDLKDKVMYLDCMDITVSQENNDIHPENYIVDNLVTNILGHICPTT